MLPEEISNYKEQVAKNNNKSDKRTLTDEDLFTNLIPIESDPRFEYLNNTDQESDTVELEMHNNSHDTKVAEIRIERENNTTNDNKTKIIVALIFTVLGAGAYLKGRYDERKRQKEKPES